MEMNNEAKPMILKDLMEEKQLNFNQPLLSVRRFSSTVTSETNHKRKTDNNNNNNNNSIAKLQPPPAYKSDLTSGPVRNAGTVPFVWEKAPGRPKDETKIQTQALAEQPPLTPPGRVSKTKQHDYDKVSNSQNVAPLDKKATKYGNTKEETKEREGFCSDDGDETYVDALDTASRSESLFMSSSVSGYDEQEAQPSRSFSSDFMIDRFLPAAKAMTYETSHYNASKKALAGQEQHRKMKKYARKERLSPLDQQRPKALPHYTLDFGKDESDDCIESENYSTMACGLFPRFCLMNPISGLRMLDKVQRNAVCGMQAKSDASHIEQYRTPNGKKCVDSQSGFTEEEKVLGDFENSMHGSDLHPRGCNKLVPCESTLHDSSYGSPTIEKTLYVDSVHMVKSQTNKTKGDFENSLHSGLHKNPSTTYSPLENSQHLNAEDVKAALQPKSSESFGSPFLVSSENSTNDLIVTTSPKVVEKSSYIQTQNSKFGLKSQLAAKSIDKGKTDLESQYFMKLGHQQISDETYFQFPLQLPSLKAPSESWLKRTLPTISKRNVTSQSKPVAKHLCKKSNFQDNNVTVS